MIGCVFGFVLLFLVGWFWSGDGWFLLMKLVGCWLLLLSVDGLGRPMRRMVQLVWAGRLIVWLEDFCLKWDWLGSCFLVGWRGC